MFNFDEAGKKGKEVMDGMLKSYAEITKGFQAIATEATDYSRKAYQDGVAHLEAVTSVKSPEAAVELHMTYMKTSYEAAVAEATKIGELYADLAKLAAKPFEAPVAAAPKEKAPAKASAKVVEVTEAASAA